MDLRNYCKGCGAVLPDGPRAEVREWCGKECYMRAYHDLDKQARLDAKRDRPPCQVCGKPIPPEKISTARYCSLTCQRVRVKARYRLQFPRLCEHCGKPFCAHHDDQRFCSVWCNAQTTFRKHQPRPCQWCGKMIENPRRAAAKYCCSTCAAYAREAAKRGE